MRTLWISLALVGLILLYVEYRYGGLPHIYRMETRHHRLSRLCEEIRGGFAAAPEYKHISVSLGKEPVDINVVGFVQTQDDADRVRAKLRPFERRADIAVNVKIDPAIRGAPGNE